MLEDELSGEHRKYLEIVERNSQRLLRLVSDLLFLAQIEAGKLALETGPLNLADTVAESIQAARPAANSKGIALSVSAVPVPVLHADRARIAQLLDNLISNAVKFTPAGGSVDVRVWPERGFALVSVEDTGMGIPADERPHLFERFFRTSNATRHAIQGTGLGLSISKAIAEAHGGRIAFTSEERVGTTFTVAFPLAAANARGAEPDETAA